VSEIAFCGLSQKVGSRDALLHHCGVNLFKHVHRKVEKYWFVVSFGVKHFGLLFLNIFFSLTMVICEESSGSAANLSSAQIPNPQ
jgi:hypothetical protein